MDIKTIFIWTKRIALAILGIASAIVIILLS